MLKCVNSPPPLLYVALSQIDKVLLSTSTFEILNLYLVYVSPSASVLPASESKTENKEYFHVTLPSALYSSPSTVNLSVESLNKPRSVIGEMG